MIDLYHIQYIVQNCAIQLYYTMFIIINTTCIGGMIPLKTHLKWELYLKKPHICRLIYFATKTGTI